MDVQLPARGSKSSMFPYSIARYADGFSSFQKHRLDQSVFFQDIDFFRDPRTGYFSRNTEIQCWK